MYGSTSLQYMFAWKTWVSRHWQYWHQSVTSGHARSVEEPRPPVLLQMEQGGGLAAGLCPAECRHSHQETCKLSCPLTTENLFIF